MTDQVDTLDEIVAELLDYVYLETTAAYGKAQRERTPNFHTENFQAKLSALLVEARIDELKKVWFDQVQDDVMYEVSPGEYVFLDDRIKELQQGVQGSQGAPASTESLTASDKQADNHNEESAR
jgi:hypothetical protein